MTAVDVLILGGGDCAEQELLGGANPDNVIVAEDQLAHLVDFMDLELLVRTDVRDTEQSATERSAYRQQVVQRIRTAQRANHMLHCALQMQFAEAGDHARMLFDAMYDGATSAINQRGTADAYLSWDQRIRGGSFVESTKPCLIFCLRSLNTIQRMREAVEQTSSSSSSTSTTPAAADDIAPSSEVWSGVFVKTDDLRKHLLEALAACMDVRELLLDPKHRSLVEGHVAGPVLPAWIYLISAFVRTVGTWLPLLLQSCLVNLPGNSTSSSGVVTSRRELFNATAIDQRSRESVISHATALLDTITKEDCDLPIIGKATAAFTEVFYLLLRKNLSNVHWQFYFDA